AARLLHRDGSITIRIRHAWTVEIQEQFRGVVTAEVEIISAILIRHKPSADGSLIFLMAVICEGAAAVEGPDAYGSNVGGRSATGWPAAGRIAQERQINFRQGRTENICPGEKGQRQRVMKGGEMRGEDPGSRLALLMRVL